MAGVTDTIFRQLCKEQGADVMVTEFVSAEGIFRRNERTLEYLEFIEAERPLGVQLFGGDPAHLGEAARMVAEWKRPDFIDLNFGCPVNKVVSKQGGSSLLRDCPLLEKVARAVVQAVAPLPVTAKIRIGWCEATINATTTARLLEDCGVQAIAVHGRTKEQGYSGVANWEVIAEVASVVRVPVIGNGDIASAADAVVARKSGVSGLMIGRAAMSAPWIFRQIKQYLATGHLPPPPTLEAQWAFIVRHCRWKVEAEGSELHALQAMRTRLMAYSRGMPEAKHLRSRFAHLASLAELEDHRRGKPRACRRRKPRRHEARASGWRRRGEDMARCFVVMHDLRPYLELGPFVDQVMRQQTQGYRLAFLEEGDAVQACAGFRFLESLSWGRFMYVDDLVTAPRPARAVLAGSLLDWLVAQARAPRAAANFISTPASSDSAPIAFICGSAWTSSPIISPSSFERRPLQKSPRNRHVFFRPDLDPGLFVERERPDDFRRGSEHQ